MFVHEPVASCGAYQGRSFHRSNAAVSAETEVGYASGFHRSVAAIGELEFFHRQDAVNFCDFPEALPPGTPRRAYPAAEDVTSSSDDDDEHVGGVDGLERLPSDALSAAKERLRQWLTSANGSRPGSGACRPGQINLEVVSPRPASSHTPLYTGSRVLRSSASVSHRASEPMAPRAPPLAPAQESPFSTHHGASAPLQAHPPPPRRDSFQRPAPPARGRALTRSACSSFSYPEHPFTGSQAPGPPGPTDGSCNAPRAGPQPASGGHAWEGWSTEPQPQQQPQPPSQPNPHRPPPRRGGVGSWEDAARPHSPLYTVSPLADHADLSADYEAYEAPLSAEIGGRPSDEAGEGTVSGGSASELRGRSGAPHGPLPEPRSRSITRLPPLHFTPHGGIPTGVQHGPLASEILSGTIVCSPVSAAGSVSGGVTAADRLFGARSTHSTGGAGPQSPCELEPTLHPLAQRRTSVSILDVARPQNARGFLPVGFRSLAAPRSPPAPHLPDPQPSAPFAEPHTHRDTTRPDHNTHQAPVPAPTSSLFSDLDKLRQLEALLDADGNPTGADDIEPAPVPSAPRRPLWPVRLPSITRTAHVPSGYAVSALRSGEPLADALGHGHAPGYGDGCGYGLGARGDEEGLLPGGGDEAARIAEAAARAGGFRTERSRRRGSC